MNRLAARIPQPLYGDVTSSFVYRPGGVASGNVFPTWQALVTAVAAVEGAKTVMVDDSMGRPVVPEGTWNLGGYTVLRGRQQGAAGGVCVLAVENRAHIAGVYQIRALRVVSESEQPVMESRDAQGDATDSVPTYVLAEGASLECQGTGPLFAVNSGGYAVPIDWYLLDDARLVQTSTALSVLLAQGRGTSLRVFLQDNSVAEPGTVRALPNAGAEVLVASPAADPTTHDPTYLGQSSRIVYDDAQTPHVSASDVQAALEALGLRLRWGSGNPEGVVSAPPGTLYLDTNGGRTLFVKESGSGNTGWVLK